MCSGSNWLWTSVAAGSSEMRSQAAARGSRHMRKYIGRWELGNYQAASILFPNQLVLDFYFIVSCTSIPDAVTVKSYMQYDNALSM